MESKLNSPSRERLFRTCKSPLKNSIFGNVKRSEEAPIEKTKSEKKERKRIKRRSHGGKSKTVPSH